MKKYIILAFVTILAAVLFVACDSDVKLDNDTAYTEILETGGAFVVDGKGYDSLQEAIDAAANAKKPGYPTITLTKDVNSRSVSVSEDVHIAINLDGNTLTFVDVEESAISVGENATLILSNGFIELRDETEGLVIVSSKDATKVGFENMVVHAADGQFSVSAITTTVVLVDEESLVYGKVYAESNTHLDLEGESELYGDIAIADSWLNIYNAFVFGDVVSSDTKIRLGVDEDDSAMIVGDVYVSGSEKDRASFRTEASTAVFGTVTATGTQKAGESAADSYVSLDIANEVTVKMLSGFLYVQSTGHVYLENVDENSTYVAAEGDSSITAPEPIVVKDGIYYIENESGITYFGNLTEAISEAGDKSIIVLLANDTQDYSEDPIAITVPLAINLNGHKIAHETNEIVFDLDEDVDFYLISVDPKDAKQLADNKEIKATITGDGNLSVINVEITGDVDINGSLVSEFGIFDGTVTAEEIYDGDNYQGSFFKGNIRAGYAYFKKATFGPSNANLPAGIDIDTGRAVKISDSVGYIGDITTEGYVTVDNSTVAGDLTIMSITTDDDVTIYGLALSANDYYRVTISGDVKASSVTAGSKDNLGATFNEDVVATEKATLINSVIGNGAGDGVFAPRIEIKNSTLNLNYIRNIDQEPAKSVSVTNSYGAIGEISASDGDAEEVSKAIILSAANGDLNVGQLDSGSDDIEITGDSNSKVWLVGPVTGNNLTAKNTGIFCDVNATGLVDISSSLIQPINDANITIATSSIDTEDHKAIEMKDVTFHTYAPTANVTTTYYANIASTEGGSISIDDCNGTARDIIATNSDTATEVGSIMIDNSSSVKVLSVGSVSSKAANAYGDVYLYGNTDSSSITVRNAVYAQTVTAGFPTSDDVYGATFEDDIYASEKVEIYKSVVGDDSYWDGVFAPEVVINGSALNLNYIRNTNGVGAAGFVSISSSTGEIGTIDVSDDLAITNLTSGSLSVGSVNASGDVTIEGGEFNGTVTITGNGTTTITGGEFGEFTFGGVHSEGNLKIKGGVFYGPTSIIGDGEINICGTTDSTYQPTQEEYYSVRFYGVQFLSEAVSIQCAFFKEEDFADVRSIVNKIDQYASDQKVFVVYSRVDSEHGWTETLSGVARYDLSSRHIYDSESAALFFYMDAYPNYQPSPSYYTITSGLFISDDSAPTFDFGDGMLNVGGYIALQKSEGGAEQAKLYSTKNDLTVYKCDETNRFIAGDSGIAVPTITTAGYCYQGL